LSAAGIDSQRIRIGVEQGQGSGKSLSLPPQLLEILSTYWRAARPGRSPALGPVHWQAGQCRDKLHDFVDAQHHRQLLRLAGSGNTLQCLDPPFSMRLH
jgi:hypothetical protein